jgi:hypothetical protein
MAHDGQSPPEHPLSQSNVPWLKNPPVAAEIRAARRLLVWSAWLSVLEIGFRIVVSFHWLPFPWHISPGEEIVWAGIFGSTLFRIWAIWRVIASTRMPISTGTLSMALLGIVPAMIFIYLLMWGKELKSLEHTCAE